MAPPVMFSDPLVIFDFRIFPPQEIQFFSTWFCRNPIVLLEISYNLSRRDFPLSQKEYSMVRYYSVVSELIRGQSHFISIDYQNSPRLTKKNRFKHTASVRKTCKEFCEENVKQIWLKVFYKKYGSVEKSGKIRVLDRDKCSNGSDNIQTVILCIRSVRGATHSSWTCTIPGSFSLISAML